MSAAPVLLKVLTISVEVLQGPNQGEKFSFEKGYVTVGRGPENDLVLAQDVKVSRQHLELHITSHEVSVRNLSQKNPVSVDGEVIVEKVLRPGASLRFGESELKIQFEKPIELKAAMAPVSASVGTNPLSVASPHLSALTTGSFPPVPAQVGKQSVGPVAPQTKAGPKSRNVGQGGGYSTPSYQPQNSSGSKGPFYLVILAVVLGGAYLFTQDQIKKKTEVRLRDSVSTQLAITSSQTEYDKAVKEIEKKGLDTIQYRMSQEQYLRGFRDYRQGQYVRAMEGFQAALSFYPQHEMARKYYTLSKRKFDEQVQFNMIQGKRYYGVSNYRLCMGFYSNVIKMKKDERDPIRREALQYYNECEVKMRGKY